MLLHTHGATGLRAADRTTWDPSEKKLACVATLLKIRLLLLAYFFFFPQHIVLGLAAIINFHRKLAGVTDRTADPKGYSIPYSVMYSI